MTEIMEQTRKRPAVTANEENKLRVKKLLTEAVTLLCKNSITYGTELSIEGLLGITVDASDVYLVNINEKVKNDANPEPGYKNAEDNDASYAKRWRQRSHNAGHELLHDKHRSRRRRNGSTATPMAPTATVIDDNHVADDIVQIKTERVDEDSDVANILTYEVTSKDVVSVIDVSHNSGLTSTASTSRTFENDIDFNASSSLHCTDRYSSIAITDVPEPVSCANQENTANTDTTQRVLVDKNFPEGAIVTMESAGTCCNAQQAQPLLADTSFCKPNLVQSMPPLLNTVKQFQLHHSTSDTWSEQRNIEADFVVLDADTSQFFDGPTACPINPMISSGDKGLHIETMSGQTSSAVTGLCNDKKKQTFVSASQAHHRIAAYTYCPMACKVCGRVLRNRTIYMRHIKTHMGCMYSCHVCSRKFNRKDSLKRHYLMLHKYDMWPSNAVEQCVI